MHIPTRLLVILFFALVPSLGEAYFTTGSNQFSLDGKIGVFIIDYRFGHEKYDLTMPLHAVRGTTVDTTALTFDVVDESGNPGKGTAYGVILSEAPHAGGYYVTPKGSAHSFRLLVLYARDKTEGNKVFRTQVVGLPFAFKGVQELSLNESELKKYTTLPLPLLEGASIQVRSREVR